MDLRWEILRSPNLSSEMVVKRFGEEVLEMMEAQYAACQECDEEEAHDRHDRSVGDQAGNLVWAGLRESPPVLTQLDGDTVRDLGDHRGWMADSVEEQGAQRAAMRA